jgi:hypothetical protein
MLCDSGPSNNILSSTRSIRRLWSSLRRQTACPGSWMIPFKMDRLAAICTDRVSLDRIARLDTALTVWWRVFPSRAAQNWMRWTLRQSRRMRLLVGFLLSRCPHTCGRAAVLASLRHEVRSGGDGLHSDRRGQHSPTVRPCELMATPAIAVGRLTTPHVMIWPKSVSFFSGWKDLPIGEGLHVKDPCEVSLEFAILRGSTRQFRLQPKQRIWGRAIATLGSAPRSYAGRWRSAVARHARSLPADVEVESAAMRRLVEGCASHLELNAAFLISFAWVRSPPNSGI